MKYLRFALVILAAAAVARAQDEERQQRPPTEIPDFSNLDEYIYEPKSTVVLSFRHLSGVKTQFSGVGKVGFPSDYANKNGLGRFYNDGAVLPDQRGTARVDGNGNPMIDPQTGVAFTDPIPPDGRTNSWTYIDNRQIDAVHAPNGFIAFHAYSADIIDTAVRNADGRASAGLDLAVSRDMGKIWKDRFTWSLVAGMSVNDVAAKKTAAVLANLTTITDLYSLYGQTPPAAPFSSPGTSTSQTVTGADGTSQTISTPSEVLISSDPVGTSTATAPNTDKVTDNWRLKGAFYTFRGGAELWMPFTSRFRAGVSLGAAVIYSGTNYSVTQTYQPEIGDAVITAENDSTTRLLPGYYADASLQFDLTEKAGFFAGAVFQSAGSYTQHLNTAASQYATKVDFANLNGIRAGMSVRF